MPGAPRFDLQPHLRRRRGCRRRWRARRTRLQRGPPLAQARRPGRARPRARAARRAAERVARRARRHRRRLLGRRRDGRTARAAPRRRVARDVHAGESSGVLFSHAWPVGDAVDSVVSRCKSVRSRCSTSTRAPASAARGCSRSSRRRPRRRARRRARPPPPPLRRRRACAPRPCTRRSSRRSPSASRTRRPRTRARCGSCRRSTSPRRAATCTRCSSVGRSEGAARGGGGAALGKGHRAKRRAEHVAQRSTRAWAFCQRAAPSASREVSRGAATVASVANCAPLSLPSAFVSLLARSLVALHHKRVYGCSHSERPPISGYVARQHKGRLHALLLQPAVLRAAPRAARRVPSRRGLFSSDTSSVF